MIYWEVGIDARAGTLISLMGLPPLPVNPRPSEIRRVTKRRRVPVAADTAARETLSKRRAGMTAPTSATKKTAQEFATTIVVGQASSSSKGSDENSYSDGDIHSVPNSRYVVNGLSFRRTLALPGNYCLAACLGVSRYMNGHLCSLFLIRPDSGTSASDHAGNFLSHVVGPDSVNSARRFENGRTL